MREQRSEEMEANIELEQARQRETQRAIVHDHSYTSKKEPMLPLEHPPREELVMHEEQDQPGHQQLVSNGCSGELTDDRCAELL